MNTEVTDRKTSWTIEKVSHLFAIIGVCWCIWHQDNSLSSTPVAVQTQDCNILPLIKPDCLMLSEPVIEEWADPAELLDEQAQEETVDPRQVVELTPTQAFPQNSFVGRENCGATARAIMNLVCCFLPCDCLPDER